MFETLVTVVGIVFCIYPVADDKYLNILEQSITRTVRMALVTVGLVKGFFEFQTFAFEFYLYQWQTVDENGYIITIFIFALLTDLVGNLKLILTPKISIDKLEIEIIAIVSDDVLFFSKGLDFSKTEPLLRIFITRSNSVLEKIHLLCFSN